MSKTKSFVISKRLVWEAWKQVRSNKGSAGIDGVTLEDFASNLDDNLYMIWNRMSSGSYFPLPVKLVEIPKSDGRMRVLGIPTVSDRVAQTVFKQRLEPRLEPIFHRDSYAYRPKKSAHMALDKTRKRCWKKDWVVDMDIKGFFDNLDHDLVMKALGTHSDERWILLYARRWLEAPACAVNGELIERKKGTPQGGVASPLLANLFMHYAFDHWMEREFPGIEFARYADDIVVHAVSLAQAEFVLDRIRDRLKSCGLELHAEKTKIVYCKDDRRRGDYVHTQFDFLGYSFMSRTAKGRNGELFNSFLPAMSDKACMMVRGKVKRWRLISRLHESLEEVLRTINPVIRGWIRYYGKYYKSRLLRALLPLEKLIVRWMTRKHKTLKRRPRQSREWLRSLAKREPKWFPLWT